MTEAVSGDAPAAERSWPVALAGLSAAGRALPVSLLLALPGLVFVAGFDHLAYGLGLLAGVVLAGLMIAPRLARAETPTLTSALRERFGSVTAAIAALLVVAVVLPLLAAELTVVSLLAGPALGAASVWAIPAALVVLLAATVLPHGERFVGTLSALAWPLLTAGLLVPLVLIAAKHHGGAAFPHIAFGRVLEDLQGLEERLIEGGLVDFDTFSAHAASFIRLAERDVLALVVTLALGVAALPHLAGALARGRHPAATRVAGAWTALFVMVLLISVPALAVYAKHAIYTAVASATPLAALPPWLEAPLASGLVRLHGTSLHLLEAVAAAMQAGGRDAAAVADQLGSAGAQWLALDAEVQGAMLTAAASLAAEPSASAWEVYRSAVLPAAAAAAGNDAATLTQAGLAIEPLGLLLVIPGLTGFPREVSLLIAAAGIVAALAVAGSLARSLADAVSDRDGRSSRFAGTIVVLAIGAIAAGLALFRPADPVVLAVSALALAAAGLFPALSVGLGWRRATAAGVVAAMLAGAGVTGYYMAGTQLYPASFYTTWPALSDAGEYAVEEFELLADELRDAESDEARAIAAAALDDLARGSATRRSLANWAGIDSASAGIFGAPVGILVLVVVSLLTRRPSRD